jgi:4-hydroxybenzoate polyprenyltransferase
LSSIANIFKLARPTNLVIIVATMYSLRYLVMWPMLKSASIGMEFRLNTLEFMLSCLIVLLVTAAGNMINDYFDQKVDKINKPERVIVGKSVKRRVAMILHQVLNIAAVVFCGFLCLKTGFWWPILIPIVSATLLWWYSPNLKQKAFWGNFTVAVLVAMVPLWTGIFEIHELKVRYADTLVNPELFFFTLWKWLLIYAGFSFLLTLAREAQKDMEDIQGDIEGHYHTLPIKIGEKKTKQYVAALLIITAILALAGSIFLFKSATSYPIAIVLIMAMVVLPILISFWQTLQANNKKGYRSASKWTKIAMAGGILFTIYLRFYLQV